jgi:hypothetical protein
VAIVVETDQGRRVRVGDDRGMFRIGDETTTLS